MTTSEVERLSRMLIEMRVESASQFATLHEQLKCVPGLIERVSTLEQKAASNGRFSWSDVFKLVATGAALITAAYTITHWG